MKRSTALTAGISASLLTVVLGVSYAIWCRQSGIAFCPMQSLQESASSPVAPTSPSNPTPPVDPTSDFPSISSPTSSETVPPVTSNSTATPPTEPSPQLTPYQRSGQYAIELNYSDDIWQLNEGDDYPPSALDGTRDLIQLVAKNQDGFQYKTNIMFRIEQVEKSNLPLGEYAQVQEFRIKQLGTFEILNELRLITLASGNAAYEVVYSGDDGEHFLKRKRIIVQPKRDSNVSYFHLITYTASVERFDEHLATFDELLRSVTVR